jgi:hypothetical protein
MLAKVKVKDRSRAKSRIREGDAFGVQKLAYKRAC